MAAKLETHDATIIHKKRYVARRPPLSLYDDTVVALIGASERTARGRLREGESRRSCLPHAVIVL